MSDLFYLRFRAAPAELTRQWVRRGLFQSAYRKTTLFEGATGFETRAEAAAFAGEQRIADVVELVVVRTEGVDAA